MATFIGGSSWRIGSNKNIPATPTTHTSVTPKPVTNKPKSSSGGSSSRSSRSSSRRHSGSSQSPSPPAPSVVPVQNPQSSMITTPVSGFNIGGSTTVTNIMSGASVVKKDDSGKLQEVSTSSGKTSIVGIHSGSSSSGGRSSSGGSIQLTSPPAPSVIPIQNPTPIGGFKIGGSTTITNILSGGSKVEKTDSGKLIEVSTSTGQSKTVGVSGSSSKSSGISSGSYNGFSQLTSPSVPNVVPVQNLQSSLSPSGGIITIEEGKTNIVQLSSSKLSRVEELKKAGFNEQDIAYLTSPAGSKYSFYNGKVVPQTKQNAAFWNQADAQSKDIEKRVSNAAVGLGLVGGGLFFLPVFAAAGAAGTAGAIVSNISLGFGLIGTGKSIPGLKDTSTSRKLTLEEQTKFIKETESRLANKYESDKNMNVAFFGDVPNIQIPFIGSTKNIMYGFPGSKIASEGIQGSQGKETGLTEFEKIGKQVLLEHGFSEKEAIANANLMRNVSWGGDVGSVLSLFPFGGIGEFGVRTGVQEALKKAPVFPTTAAAATFVKDAAKRAATVPAIVEGITMYAGQQYARDLDIKPEGVILSGALSGATGRYGAGWIAEQSIKNPALANIVYKGSWFAGQFDEPLGDVFTDIMQRAVGKSTSTLVKIAVPTVTISPSVSTSSKTHVNDVEFINNLSAANWRMASNTYLPSDKVTGNIGTLINTFSTGTQTDTGTGTSSNTGTGSTSNTNTVDDSVTQTFTDTVNNSLTETQTSTATATNTWTNTYVMSHSANLPFIPLGGGFGLGNGEAFGRGGVAVRQRKKYYDELAAATSILQENQRLGMSAWNGVPFKTNKEIYNTSKRKQINLLKKELKALRSKNLVKSKNIYNPRNFMRGFL